MLTHSFLMSEQLLEILRLGLLALLYLFFARVMWAVWTELRNPVPVGGRARRRASNQAAAAAAPQPAPAQRRRGKRSGSQLIVQEPEHRRGTTFALDVEMTIGRAAGCTIVVEDSFVSQVHTRIFESGGTYYLEDLGSTNGTFHNGGPVDAAVVLHRGDTIKIGDTVLEFA